jgi:hypothetical protein
MLHPIGSSLAQAIVTLVMAATFTLLSPNFASAQTDPAICYWQSSTGQMIDLSTICGPSPAKSDRLTVLQSHLKNYSPAIQQEVSQYIEQHRPSVSAQAQTTCRTLRYGGQQAANTRRAALIAYEGGSEAIQARQEAIDATAIVTYCPEFAAK